MNLPKRDEIKKLYRDEASESGMEAELKHQLLKRGIRAEQQYKIGPFFVDFALPEFKIAIEYDGADYHLDIEKDEARDSYLRKQGWDVVRIALKKHLRSVKVNGEVPIISLGEEYGVRMDEEHYIWDLIAKHVKNLMFKNRDYMVRYSAGIENESGGFQSVKNNLKDAFDRLYNKATNGMV